MGRADNEDLLMSQIPRQRLIDAAIAIGSRSPCEKSKRGAIVMLDGLLVTGAYNRMPLGLNCDGTAACRAVCGKACLHAESRALHAARRALSLQYLQAAELLHVKVRDGQAVPSGPPSCWQCSREVYEYVRGIWLFHESGWAFYEAEDFYQRTLENCGLVGCNVALHSNVTLG